MDKQILWVFFNPSRGSIRQVVKMKFCSVGGKVLYLTCSHLWSTGGRAINFTFKKAMGVACDHVKGYLKTI